MSIEVMHKQEPRGLRSEPPLVSEPHILQGHMMRAEPPLVSEPPILEVMQKQ